VHKLYGLCV